MKIRPPFVIRDVIARLAFMIQSSPIDDVTSTRRPIIKGVPVLHLQAPLSDEGVRILPILLKEHVLKLCRHTITQQCPMIGMSNYDPLTFV